MSGGVNALSFSCVQRNIKQQANRVHKHCIALDKDSNSLVIAMMIILYCDMNCILSKKSSL